MVYLVSKIQFHKTAMSQQQRDFIAHQLLTALSEGDVLAFFENQRSLAMVLERARGIVEPDRIVAAETDKLVIGGDDVRKHALLRGLIWTSTSTRGLSGKTTFLIGEQDMLSKIPRSLWVDVILPLHVGGCRCATIGTTSLDIRWLREPDDFHDVMDKQ